MGRRVKAAIKGKGGRLVAATPGIKKPNP